MLAIEKQPIPHYMAAPQTEAELDYADLAIIDLANAKKPHERMELAARARDAMIKTGFFYVIGHGYTQEQADRMVDIADVPFAQVSDDEKRVYAGTMKQTGSYQGYKLRNYWHIDGGVRDQLENYNINRDVTKKTHPAALRPLLPEIYEFARFNHFHVLHEVFRLLALGLELPQDTFVNLHGYDAVGESYVRFMKYYPRSDEEEVKSKNVWLKGHTDFGTITILWSQPVAALQIFSSDGTWKWVKHIPNALVINAGDALSFLTAGIFPATIHRVVQPPPDQRQYTRLGAFYFSMTDDNVRLAPLTNSPLVARRLAELSAEKRAEIEKAPTMEEWRKGRTAAYGQTELRKSDAGSNVEEEIISGVVVKHYN
ncbi:Clavaminate synthase-like protein [Rickenella mellea]|uniref:Clavaminate synthase-like protein n=1 Tax=Rickenella mellea TaxID=50990 RepID=A0A4Y7Q207_9AGAM|nr:Clavaminate synthase-like protein [Rickenella mellea]